jgi:spore coat protein U-like protein
MSYIPWFGPGQPMTRQRASVTIESRLYDAKTMNIVWRSTVDAVSPTGSDDQISRFVSLVVKTLRDKKLIPSSLL